MMLIGTAALRAWYEEGQLGRYLFWKPGRQIVLNIF